MQFYKFTPLVIVITFCLLSLPSYAQNTQVVKGTIIDKQSELPLIGATVEWLNDDGNIGAVTDIDGYFRLEGIPIGRQVFRISYLGYEPMTIPNVVVTAGKEVVLNLSLQESVEQLDEVVVTASVDKDRAQNEMATISARQFSVEEVTRYSGGRSDVARLATNFAGVSTADDSRNDIVIRGNSPTGVLWRLEGIPIPNPNHFASLGATGGAVSALNPNVIKNSDFLTSAFPAEYGNALAGVFDIGMRTGNRDRHEFMFQMGAFTGLEANAEGPLSKNGKGSYLLAVRYGLVGVFGGGGGTSAVPNYSDVAFKVTSGTTKAGQFTFFGIGGTSAIDFLHDDVDEDDLFAAADEDSFVDSRFGVIGMKHNLLLGDNAYIRTVISGALSVNELIEERYFNLDQDDEFTALYTNFDNTETRLSISSYLNKKFSARFSGRMGVLVENTNYDLLGEDAEVGTDNDGDGVRELGTLYNFDDNALIVQPFVQTQYRINQRWTLNTGLRAQYLALNETFALEPRAAINWNATDKQRFSLGYGLHHQTQPIPILLAASFDSDGEQVRTNEGLNFTRSHHFVLGYDYNFAPGWRLKTELYYQDISNVAVDSDPTSFSVLNAGADFSFPNGKVNLVNEGVGANYGVEITVEKFFSKGYYGLLTASIYESTYEGSDGIERNTAFDNTYVLNILGGKEWKIGKDKRHAFTVDTKITTAGGRRYTPVDLEASVETGFEVLQDDIAFSERFDPYFRWDIKFGMQFNSRKRKVSHRFFIDLQNVLDTDNVFIRRYNRLNNEVNVINQIGFFPDFLYRIEF
ncbi:MAG: TonB-dependent receptor [Bacteroidota bacterium]